MSWRKLLIGFAIFLGLFLVIFRKAFQWGYYEEWGDILKSTYLQQTFPKDEREEFQRWADVCGDLTADDVAKSIRENTFYTNVWYQDKVMRHFFMYEPFSTVIWITVGIGDRVCSARYWVSAQKYGCAWPFNFCNQYSGRKIVDTRLLSRTQRRPKAPPGIETVILGECARWALKPGEVLKVRARVPDYGQQVEVLGREDPWRPESSDSSDEARRTVYRNGTRVSVEGVLVQEPGGGVFDLVVVAPTRRSIRYAVSVAWEGGRGCASDLKTTPRTRLEEANGHD